MRLSTRSSQSTRSSKKSDPGIPGTLGHGRLQTQRSHWKRIGKSGRKAVDSSNLDEFRESPSTWKELLQAFVENEQVERALGALILLNLVLIAVETDARSMVRRGGAERESQKIVENAQFVLDVTDVIGRFFFACYALECVARLVAYRCAFFASAWNVLDITLVAGDSLGIILTMGNVGDMSFLRVLRMCRLLRVSRTFMAFREMHSLISGLVCSFQTLARAFGLIFLALTLWSIAAVEYVSPLAESHTFETCTWCNDSFHTVMMANLTLFGIITTGDGFSLLIRPIITSHPLTALLFLSAIILVAFGLLNLVTAAIIDAATRARAADVAAMSQYATEARDEIWWAFREMRDEIARDSEGNFGLDDLREAMKESSNLRDQFSIMSIEEDDLPLFFAILDADGSGSVNDEEFQTQLYKLKTAEVRTQVFYMRKTLDSVVSKIERHGQILERMWAHDGRSSVSSSPGLMQTWNMSQTLDCDNHKAPTSSGTEVGHMSKLEELAKLSGEVVPTLEKKAVEEPSEQKQAKTHQGCQPLKSEAWAHKKEEALSQAEICIDMRPLSFFTNAYLDASPVPGDGERLFSSSLRNGDSTSCRGSNSSSSRPHLDWMQRIPVSLSENTTKLLSLVSKDACFNERESIWRQMCMAEALPDASNAPFGFDATVAPRFAKEAPSSASCAIEVSI